MGFERTQRAQHLQLLVAHPIGFQRHRRFHRDQAQKLQHVVLQHVAQRARVIVVAAALLHADRLGDRDLHVVDHVGIPQPFEDRVGEAEREQVLHRLLAEVVVDAEGLRLAEHRADLVVDLARRGEVVTDRLLQHDARLLGDQAVRTDVATDRTVEIGRRGEIEDTHLLGVEHVRERMPVRLGIRRVQPDVADAAAEPVGGVRVEILARDVLTQRLAGALAVGFVVEVGACRGDDVRVRRHLAVAEPVVERRQQLAQRQVAGGAEHHAVEGRDGDDLRHGCISSGGAEGLQPRMNTDSDGSSSPCHPCSSVRFTPQGRRRRPC